MKLRERLNSLPERLGCVNKPTDWYIDGCLTTAIDVLVCLREDLLENEPQAHQSISDINAALDLIPTDCNEIKEIGRERKE